MRRLDSFLIASFLVFAPSCGRTGLFTPAAGVGGTMARGGTAAGGAAVGTGGSTSASGGLSGHGGAQATGGQVGAGGAVSGAGGSSPDTCSIDSDCAACIWETAPTDSSHCAHSYCCGGMIVSKKRCEANQAAWSSYCPNQSPKDESCKCVGCDGQAIGCVGGQCVCGAILPVMLVETSMSMSQAAMGRRWLAYGGARSMASP